MILYNLYIYSINTMTSLQKWNTLLQVARIIEYQEAMPYYGLRFERGELYIQTGKGTYHPLLDEFKISNTNTIERLKRLPPPIFNYLCEYLQANCSTSSSGRNLYNLF
jgi:hypothetical protein